MDSMVDDALINPRREKGEPELSASGLLCINPGDMKHLGPKLEKAGAKRHFFFNSNLYTVSGSSDTIDAFVAGPAVGAPMAVIALEKLIALGAKRVIVYGWCGSLSPKLPMGDVLIPTRGLSEEGTSCHYPITGKAAGSENLRRMMADYLNRETYQLQEGPVWTTDAPYRETKGKVREYSQKGVLGVDMEFSALATVAIYRQIELGAVFLVSDELWKDQWRPTFKDKSFITKNRIMLDRLLKMICEMGGK
jgi:uridine phosphorylase